MGPGTGGVMKEKDTVDTVVGRLDSSRGSGSFRT